jgi:hypothetical protein
MRTTRRPAFDWVPSFVAIRAISTCYSGSGQVTKIWRSTTSTATSTSGLFARRITACDEMLFLRCPGLMRRGECSSFTLGTRGTDQGPVPGGVPSG